MVRADEKYAYCETEIHLPHPTKENEPLSFLTISQKFLKTKQSAYFDSVWIGTLSICCQVSDLDISFSLLQSLINVQPTSHQHDSAWQDFLPLSTNPKHICTAFLQDDYLND
jgi:hypothetical protein